MGWVREWLGGWVGRVIVGDVDGRTMTRIMTSRTVFLLLYCGPAGDFVSSTGAAKVSLSIVYLIILVGSGGWLGVARGFAVARTDPLHLFI